MALELWLPLVILFMAGGLTPGPAVGLVLASSFRYGFKAAMLAAYGIASANVIWLLLAVSGVATLAYQFPRAFLGMKIFGLLVIAYMAVSTMIGPLPDLDQNETNTPKGRLFAKGFGLQVSSPLPLVYFGLILPTFVDRSRDIWVQFWIMLATVTATELVGLAVYASGAQGIRNRLRDKIWAKRFNIAVGLVMIGSGVFAIAKTLSF